MQRNIVNGVVLLVALMSSVGFAQEQVSTQSLPDCIVERLHTLALMEQGDTKIYRLAFPACLTVIGQAAVSLSEFVIL